MHFGPHWICSRIHLAFTVPHLTQKYLSLQCSWNVETLVYVVIEKGDYFPNIESIKSKLLSDWALLTSFRCDYVGRHYILRQCYIPRKVQENKQDLQTLKSACSVDKTVGPVKTLQKCLFSVEVIWTKKIYNPETLLEKNELNSLTFYMIRWWYLISKKRKEWETKICFKISATNFHSGY